MRKFFVAVIAAGAVAAVHAEDDARISAAAA
jgi:hypothetical protein